jgi:hypothetical protein
MTYHDDPDLERRLRRIAESPEPPVPGSVFHYANEVTTKMRGSSMTARFAFFSKSRTVVLAGAIGALVVAVAVAGLIISTRSQNVASKPTPTASVPATSPSPSSATASPLASPSLESTPVSQVFTAEGTPPEDIVTEGADPAAAWSEASFGSAPAGMASWGGMPERWSGGWVTSGLSVQGYDTGENNPLWLSTDGRTWHVQVGPPRLIVGPGGPFSAGPGGLWAYSETTAWSSPDGSHWTAHPVELPNGGSVYMPVGNPAGLLATTIESLDLLFSPDGVTWQRVALPLAGPIASEMWAWTGTRFLAVVEVELTGGDYQVAAFTSADGRTWSDGVSLPSGSSTHIVGLFVADAGIVATFTQPGSTQGVRTLWSADGSTWQVDAQVEAFRARADNRELTLESNGERFLATVSLPAGWELWTSFDGLTWTRLQAAIANEQILLPELAPRGIFLGPGGACWATQQGGGCTSYPPDFPYYGPAK